MMFTITKEFSFSASHQLKGLPSEHPCSRLHGHNYRVEITLAAQELDETGFVRDYGEVKALGRWLDETFDHQHLNERVSVNPTAENLAVIIFNRARSWWPEVAEVRVSETPTTWASYSA